MKNKYLKAHSLLRMFAALLAIIVFVSMFITKLVLVKALGIESFYDFRSGAVFGGDLCQGNVLGFFAYLFVLLGGLAGLAFLFIDELIGKQLTKTLSFVAGGVAGVGAILVMLFAPIFIAINDFQYCHTAAGPIVFGILALLFVAVPNIAAPILEEKGY